MPNNFRRPNLPYINISLPNDKRYQLLTRSNRRPPTDQMIDTDINYIIDGLNVLDLQMEGIALGDIPGIDEPANVGKLLSAPGDWIFIQASNILDQSITGGKLFPQTITATQLADGGVGADQLGPNAVTTIKILDANVTQDKMGGNSVGTDQIIDLNVTADKLAADSVLTDKIVDLNVTTAKIANSNVTLAKLAQEVSDRLVPIGTVVEFAGTVGFSANWLECNGQAVSRATYATLFANLATIYGTGDGATTFNLPDRRGTAAVGIGSDSSTNGKITAATAADIALGKTFGAETVTLDVTQIPAHTHSTGFQANAQSGVNFETVGTAGFEARVTGSAGGGLPHSNTQPSIFTRYYIRAL